MRILGINSGELNSSAALIENGQLVSGAPEERFNRQKKTRIFPENAIKFILEQSGITIGDIDCIAQGWNPGDAWIKFNPILSHTRVKREDYFYSIPDSLFNFSRRDTSDWVEMNFSDGLPPIYFVKHHLCHAANAFFLSGFDEAAIFTADLKGEFESTSRSIGIHNRIERIDEQRIPHSLGLFYATYTELLGFRSDNDEWKVMALSAYDVDCDEYVRKIRSTVELKEDGSFELDQSYYKGVILDQPHLHTEKLASYLNIEFGETNFFDDEVIKIAKAMQLVAEEVAIHCLESLRRKTKSRKLVCGGGFFMNSVLNGKILKETGFDDFYTSFAPDDVGNSIGAALYVHHCIRDRPREKVLSHSSIGPKFTPNAITDALTKRGIEFEVLDSPEGVVANLVQGGEIVALFQGRMEFGDRALGNRSILGDPRDVSIKDRINSLIKYREPFRPFAPATLIERAKEFFDVPADYVCYFMEKVIDVRSEFRHKIPGVVHVDGSGRLQTVSKDRDLYFYTVIEEFGKLTGIPVVLNTSFNINGEPIVLSPDDAISTFFNSGLKCLVMENILVWK